MSRFVLPETEIITLANGDTLTVWSRLNAGQANRRYARMYTTASDGTRIVDLLEVGRATVIAYLVDWCLADDDIPIRGVSPDEMAAVLDNLHPDDFIEIRDAIDAHEKRQREARDAEKKSRTGESKSSPISTSPGVATGAMNG